jgi:hypothetical protein
MRKLFVPLAISVALLLSLAAPALAADPTASVRVVKYDSAGGVVAGTVKDYRWLEANLPVQGDGVTHYYHQGPIFEGDPWDPAETQNLKDKGAVKGTALKDLCGLVGGMSRGDEVMIKATDGWRAEFAYENIYEPLDIQGVITLCWYCGEDALSGERYGTGYPGPGSFHSAMLLVFLAGTPNSAGKYVFGNADMALCLPDEKYQHFFEGLPSTNGLCGKWISEVAIFSGEAPVTPGEKLPPATPPTATPQKSSMSPVPVIIGAAGVIIVAGSIFLILRRKRVDTH